MLAGHAFGDPVLLVHAGDNWFATGAKCSHYEAPLADGLLVGNTLRCPWHHACFDVRTGAATGAPALNDVPTYSVEVSGDTVRVTGKSSADKKPKAGKSKGSAPASVVIIGAGAAGNACAEMLRREGYAGPVVMIDGDSDAPYDRPNVSKDYLAGNAPEEWMPLHPPDFYKEQKIEILSGVTVAALDTKGKTVKLSDGNSRSYGALLLATGASPIRLKIPGGESILYLRSLADCRAVIQKSAKAKKALVIGASFIGLEVAASLRARGLDVVVVAPEKVPLEKVMGPELGALIRTLHERQGVQFRLGRSAASISGSKITLDDGSSLEADLIVAGIGVRPNTDLAESAGISGEKGIGVNEFLETSAPSVYAAGDIARWPDKHLNAPIRVEHWVVAERQGQAAAKNILGARVPFTDVPFFWSRHYDLSIRYTGHADEWDSVRVDGDIASMDCSVEFLSAGKRLATVTINRDLRNLEDELAMEGVVAG
jgi:NADPH-dependent 2,4-dienoyl-CoA reductase/sulfur reductase-like enzyme/nitrite reductase/ring-hydroxylating ferredoxin subunit